MSLSNDLQKESVLILACGALANEIQAVIKANCWQNHFDLQCLSAELHNTPELIAPELEKKIRYWKPRYSSIYLAYGDCGSKGAIDRLLQTEKVERLPGAHCYEFFAGKELFSELFEEEPGTFFLTDYLTRNFERLVVKGLKLDKHPELLSVFFSNYKRVIYLVQRDDPKLSTMAFEIAEYLNLEFEKRYCGYGELEPALQQQVLAVG